MPHLTAEYSSNLDHLAVRPLLHALNAALIASGQFEALDIKSRALRLDDYLVGEADSGHAFVHVRLDLLAGRSDTVKQALSTALLQVLDTQVAAPAGIALQRCVEVRDIHRASYAKSCA